MSLGFSAIALPALKALSNSYRLTNSQASWVGRFFTFCALIMCNFLFYFAASIASVATPFGCFLSGPISDKYGRRTALILINIVGIIGWIIIAVAYHYPETQYSILLVGRIITGLSTGLSSMPASVYMAEVSSSKLRGVFTTWSAIFFSIGVLIVYALGYYMKVSVGSLYLLE